MMIRRSSGPRNRRSTAPTPPVNFWVYFDTALALMNSQRHSLIHFTAGCNATTTSTIRIIDPPNSAPAAPPTRLAQTTHDDTAASMRFEPECPFCGCKPAQLDVGIIVGHFLVETYVK